MTAKKRILAFALWLTSTKGKTKQIRNEKIKLKAAFFNNISIGQFLAALVFIDHLKMTTGEALISIFAVGILGWMGHLAAAHWLNDLEE